jgi:hypothetical protein
VAINLRILPPLRPHERVCVSVREWEEEKEEEVEAKLVAAVRFSPLQPGDANAAPQSGPARGSAAEGGNPGGGARVPVAIWITWASPSWWVRRYDVLLETARSTRGTLCCSSSVISRFFPFSFFPCLMHSRIQNMWLHLTCYSYSFLPSLMYDLVQIHIKFHLQKNTIKLKMIKYMYSLKENVFLMSHTTGPLLVRISC